MLTLSATPIPRTLHMSLMGVRDLSLIQTAPKNRMSIKTVVVPAARRDRAARDHDRTRSRRPGLLPAQPRSSRSTPSRARSRSSCRKRASPSATDRCTSANSSRSCRRFIDGEIDVLVATTIIENGIDIPNVNTIIVNDADKFGLAQLYQLRGRVGRSNHQAYCYLLYQAHKALTEDAKARLEAIREFTHLGSGLQIAMRDLEIRGAGNLLGAAQSGFIASVGFETYCELLAEAIAAAARHGRVARRAPRGGDRRQDQRVRSERLHPAGLAEDRRLPAARGGAHGARGRGIVAGVRDRFGPFPAPLENLVEITKLRALALQKHVTRVVIDEKRLTLGVGTGFALDPPAIPQLQSLTKNRFRFGEGKILVDLPTPNQKQKTRRRLDAPAAKFARGDVTCRRGCTDYEAYSYRH